MALYDGEGNLVDGSAVTGSPEWQVRKEFGSTEGEVMTGQAFEAEKLYMLVAELVAQEGYSFPEYVTLELNGEELELYTDPKNASHWGFYSLMTPLSQVEVFGLPECKAGEELVEDLTCDAEEVMAYAWWSDENGDSVEDTTLQPGKTYYAYVTVMTWFQDLAEDFVIVADGKTYEPTALDLDSNMAEFKIEYKVPAEADDVEDDALAGGTGADNNADDAGNEKAPATGDHNMVMGWALLVAAAAASMVFVRRREM